MCNLSCRWLLSFLSENKDSFSNDLLFYESNTQTAGKSTRMGDRENVLKESFALLHFFIALASVTFQFGTFDWENVVHFYFYILKSMSHDWFQLIFQPHIEAQLCSTTERSTFHIALSALHCSCGWGNLTSPFGCHGFIETLFLQTFFWI